jgi:hypothetical protein
MHFKCPEQGSLTPQRVAPPAKPSAMGLLRKRMIIPRNNKSPKAHAISRIPESILTQI